jgi:serine/threonine protein kinase
MHFLTSLSYKWLGPTPTLGTSAFSSVRSQTAIFVRFLTREPQYIAVTSYAISMDAYTNRIRHKDIKPQNILVKGMNVLITDFGTALDWSKDSGATTSGHPGPTSVNYIAPEVAEHEDRNESSDIWSLGCVFLEMTVKCCGANFTRTIADKTRLY